MVEDYVIDLKKRVNPNSVPTYVNPLQTFLDVNENEIKWKKIRLQIYYSHKWNMERSS